MIGGDQIILTPRGPGEAEAEGDENEIIFTGLAAPVVQVLHHQHPSTRRLQQRAEGENHESLLLRKAKGEEQINDFYTSLVDEQEQAAGGALSSSSAGGSSTTSYGSVRFEIAKVEIICDA